MLRVRLLQDWHGFLAGSLVEVDEQQALELARQGTALYFIQPNDTGRRRQERYRGVVFSGAAADP